MNDPNLLDYVTAMGSAATPVLVLILTAVGWAIRKRIGKAYELEEKLRDDRIQVYNQILEPFMAQSDLTRLSFRGARRPS